MRTLTLPPVSTLQSPLLQLLKTFQLAGRRTLSIWLRTQQWTVVWERYIFTAGISTSLFASQPVRLGKWWGRADQNQSLSAYVWSVLVLYGGWQKKNLNRFRSFSVIRPADKTQHQTENPNLILISKVGQPSVVTRQQTTGWSQFSVLVTKTWLLLSF